MYQSKTFQSPDELTVFLNENAISRHQIVSISQGIEELYKTPQILLVYETTQENIIHKTPISHVERATGVLAAMAKCGISSEDLMDVLRSTFND